MKFSFAMYVNANISISDQISNGENKGEKIMQ